MNAPHPIPDMETGLALAAAAADARGRAAYAAGRGLARPSAEELAADAAVMAAALQRQRANNSVISAEEMEAYRLAEAAKRAAKERKFSAP